LAKEGGWIVFGQAASILGALLLVRVLTQHLDPAKYGQLALGLTVAGLVNQVVMGGISGGIGRYYSIAVERKELPGYLGASFQMMGFATVTVSVIALPLMVGLYWLECSQWMGLAAAAMVFSVLSSYNSSLNGIQNAARQRSIVAFHGGLDAWLKILFALGVMLWLGSSSTAVVIGYILSSLIVIGSQVLFLRRLFPSLSPAGCDYKPWRREMWAYSWPFSTWGIFTWAQQSSDRWALQAFASTQEVGQYAVLFQLGFTPIFLAGGLAMNFLGPVLYQRSGDATDQTRIIDTYQITRKLTIAGLIMTLIGFLLGYGLHKWIFQLLINKQYHAVSYLLPWMILSAGFMSCHHILGMRVSSLLRTKELVYPQIIMASLAISLNIIGAFLNGITGLTASMVIFSIIYFLWMAYFSNNIFRNSKFSPI